MYPARGVWIGSDEGVSSEVTGVYTPRGVCITYCVHSPVSIEFSCRKKVRLNTKYHTSRHANTNLTTDARRRQCFLSTFIIVSIMCVYMQHDILLQPSHSSVLAGSCVFTSSIIHCPVPVPWVCLLYTSPSPRDRQKSRMPSSA